MAPEQWDTIENSYPTNLVKWYLNKIISKRTAYFFFLHSENRD